MTHHTPGPWVAGSLLPPEWRYILDADHNTIAVVAEWNNAGVVLQNFQGAAKARANARLIASAPDLLECLKDARAMINELRAIIDDEDPHGWHNRVEDPASHMQLYNELCATIDDAEGKSP